MPYSRHAAVVLRFIPISSTSHFVNSHLVNVDKVGIDEVGRFTILYTFNHCCRSVNFLVHQSGDNKTVWRPWV